MSEIQLWTFDTDYSKSLKITIIITNASANFQSYIHWALWFSLAIIVIVYQVNVLMFSPNLFQNEKLVLEVNKAIFNAGL